MAAQQLAQQAAALEEVRRVAHAGPVVLPGGECAVEHLARVEERRHQAVQRPTVEVGVDEGAFGGDLQDDADARQIAGDGREVEPLDVVGRRRERGRRQIAGDAQRRPPDGGVGLGRRRLRIAREAQHDVLRRRPVDEVRAGPAMSTNESPSG